MADLGTQESKIGKYLSQKNKKKRLQFQDDLVEVIQSKTDYSLYLGVGLYGVWTKEREGWKEYEVLLEVNKFEDSVDYLEFMFRNLAGLIGDWSKEDSFKGIDSIGVQELDATRADKYYILIFITK